MPDPYLYPDVPVLRNKLEIKTEKTLDLVEAEQSRANMMLFYDQDFTDFTPAGLQQIHKFRVHHIHQFQLTLGDLGADAAVAQGEAGFLDQEVQTANGINVAEDVICHRGKALAHGLADLHLLAVLLGADTGALNAQLVLLRIGGGVEQLFLHLLLGGANFT